MNVRLLLLPLLLLLPGCQSLSFVAQAVRGQSEIIFKSRPNPAVIDDPATPGTIRDQLILAQELCRFASERLDLPGHSSYQRYADLGRKHVVWVVHATPPLSLEPLSWNYPIVGEMTYRGYFSEADATALADDLRAKGYDVNQGGVNAYSTLGYFHDPILNTFVTYTELELAELIFHELTHRRLYVKDQTMFNESLASMVSEEGVKLWLTSKNRMKDLADYEARLKRRTEFYEAVSHTRAMLQEVYDGDLPDSAKLQRKKQLLAELKGQFQRLQNQWGGSRLQSWIDDDLTNAHLAALATYHEDIPRLRSLLREQGGNFPAFFAIARPKE
jgi:predicted aminopeptidase